MNVGAPEIIFIVVVILLLFGAKKLPEAARSVGRSMRIFKSEINEMSKDGEAADTDAHAHIPAQQPAQLPPNPQVSSQGYVNNGQFQQQVPQPYTQQGQPLPQQQTITNQQPYPQQGQQPYPAEGQQQPPRYQ